MGERLRVVLVGTGTGVGKTHVACSLLRRWTARGASAVGLKPIETGIGADGPARTRSDQTRLLAASGLFHVKHRSASGATSKPFHAPQRGATSPLFAFADPISPHLAARRAGVRLDVTAIDRWVNENGAPITVVETAGGLFSPLGNTATNLDLAIALRADAVILVAPDRLGALHDVTATLGFAAARGLVLGAVVLSAPEVADASTGTNEGELAALRIVRPLATFPRATDRDPRSLAAADQVIAWIER